MMPNVHTIPASANFIGVLAELLLDGTLCASPDHPDPSPLHTATVLLPNRRAVRALTSALIARAGRPLLLPRIAAIGDVDEDRALVEQATAPQASFPPDDALPDLPPPATALERHLALTRLVLAFGQSQAKRLAFPEQDAPLNVPQGTSDASALSLELAGLLDSLHGEGVDPKRLGAAVDGDHAAYWQVAHEFVRIVVDAWPHYLAELGRSDPVDRRNRLIAAEADRLSRLQPQAPFIVAGSTGSVPATAKLIAAIARLPRGHVILPGLDTHAGEDTWRAIGAEATPHPAHPQYGLQHLLASIGVSRDDVGVIGTGRDANDPRLALISEVFRPAHATGDWRVKASDLELEPACAGLTIVEAANPRQEALAIAFALREAIENGARDAALVTPDRGLARRVAIAFRRWGLEIDDSAGQTLSATLPATFVRLLAETCDQEFAPAALSALLSHPLFGTGDDEAVRSGIAALETMVLRGPRPAPGIAPLRDALEAIRDDKRKRPRNRVAARQMAGIDNALSVLDAIEAATAPLQAIGAHGGETRFRDFAAALFDAASALSFNPDGGARIATGDAGEAVASLFDEVATCRDDGLAMPFAGCITFLSSVMATVTVRPPGRDRRISILGPLEARLQQFGRVVIGGLNEGTWPSEPATDPWLNRAMRAAIGLEPPERRIGLAAHDVAQLMAGPDVVMTRSQRDGGAPTIASRWLQRLEAVAGQAIYHELCSRGDTYARWAEQLDQPSSDSKPEEPRPAPPVSIRPRQLSVTQIETLVRDPYAIYAQKILALDPLPPLDDPSNAAQRGSIVHDALAAFIAAHPADLPANAADDLMDRFEAAMVADSVLDHTRALWRPRLRRIADWFAEHERAWREEHRGLASHVEIDGALDFTSPGGTFSLTGRADRIDTDAEGRLHITDYKTGAAPSAKQVQAHLAPQLTLEAAMAEAGAFKGIGGGTAETLRYVRLSGARDPGEVKDVDGGEAHALSCDAFDGLKSLIAHYDDPAAPYRARVSAKLVRDDAPFDHLSRYREWSVADGDEGGRES